MKSKIEKLFAEKKIESISLDSRKIGDNCAFFAISGQKSNVDHNINDARKNGAVLIFSDDLSKKEYKDIVYVENVRDAVSIACEIFYPNLPKNLIGVTGTNGKTSVVSYVYQILSLLKKEVASIGTVGIQSTKNIDQNLEISISGYTTSDVISFHNVLTELYNNKIDNVVFEASSHGLDQKRMGNVKLQTGAFTSFSQDHLDYHKNMSEYLDAKLKLFSNHLNLSSEAVINSEMEHIDEVKNFLGNHNIKYNTVGQDGDLSIKKFISSLEGQEVQFSFCGKNYQFKTNIIGSFQSINILIAVKLVYNLGINFEDIIQILPHLTPVIGRMQRITDQHHQYQIFVDYAHTPDALEKTLKELSVLKKDNGNLYVIFGCGGDRDNSKRPLMGKIASKIADYIIITDDNPRNEAPETIRKDILSGISEKSRIIEISGREKAIIDTIAKLSKNDILLIAGKGHEDYQIIQGKKIPFSDIEIALREIKN